MRYSGTRGNDAGRFDVLTYFDGVMVHRQTVASAQELVGNDYVLFEKARL